MESHDIEVKSRMFFRIWLFLATGGAVIAGVWLVSEAITFESKYALLYLGGGLMAIVYGLITFSMVLPAFTSRGHVFFVSNKDLMGRFSQKNAACLLLKSSAFIWGAINTV